MITVLILLLTTNFMLLDGHREEDCVEVGFARASFSNIEQGYNAAKEEILAIWEKEDKMNTPSYKFLNPQLKNVTRAALLLEKASKNILGIIRKTRVGKRCQEKWLLRGIEKHVLPHVQLDKELAEEIGLIMSFRCLVGTPYPNVDGTCNHEQAPDQGGIGSKFLRLIPSVAGGAGFGLRESVNKEKILPSARHVSKLIRRRMKKPSVTALFVELSHYVALDSINIPEAASVEVTNCCLHPDNEECAPIMIDEVDEIYKIVKCINFRRSAPAQAILGHRDLLTMVSTYFDASFLYGETNEIAFDTKEGYFGYLKYPHSLDEDNKKKKKKEHSKKVCQFPSSFKGCFKISPDDDSFPENLRLLLILEHNFIADSLAELNPHFDDSLLYNEARRILIAEYSAIIYGDFIRLLVGDELVAKHELSAGATGPASSYIPDVNPGILNSYALASYRNPSMVNEWRSEWGETEILSPRHYEGVRKDKYVDMLAMDVQRGRDHGIASYSSWREFCEPGKGAGSWEGIEKLLAKEVVEELKDIYQDEVQDIDLLVALLEPSQDGSIHGKTFSCLVVDQFARLRTGNRFFWEFESSLLTAEQKDTIRTHSSAGALLCRHLTLTKIPQNPFLPVSESNPEIECSSLPKLDLSAWKDVSPTMEKQPGTEDDSEVVIVRDEMAGEDGRTVVQEKEEEIKEVKDGKDKQQMNDDSYSVGDDFSFRKTVKTEL